MSKNKILIILGMHRSGTSVTAQWIDACGLNIGDRLLGEHFSNPKGHFEDLDFLTLHEDILKDNKLNINGLWGEIDQIEISDYFDHKIKCICNFKKDLHDQFGWKEPRTCLFAELYAKILPEAKFLIVFRNFAEVRTSLINREITQKLNYYRDSSLQNYLKMVLFKKRYLNKWIARYNSNYLKINLLYHNKLLSFINKTDNDRMVVVNVNGLIYKDVEIIKKLNTWGFNMKPVKFHTFFDNHIMNRRIPLLENINVMTEEEQDLYNEINKYSL